MNDFACFILSHGRAQQQHTYKSLRRLGYTGKIYIIIDNEDKAADEYYSLYDNKDNCKVIMFDKAEEAKTTDSMGNFEGRKAIVYARNANFKIAKDLGIRYFLQLDDDYTSFNYMYNQDNVFGSKNIKNLDSVFNITLNYYKSIDAESIAFLQGGDLIGGDLNTNLTNNDYPFKKRKCMNTWFMDVEKPINFTGKMNEDLTASVYYGNLGKIFMSIPLIKMIQKETQLSAGGMTDTYLDNGTYVKTFYSIMKIPSCVKVSIMGDVNKRLHHNVSWNNAVPKIIDEKYKK